MPKDKIKKKNQFLTKTKHWGKKFESTRLTCYSGYEIKITQQKKSGKTMRLR
jgi:hypothetical protein